MKITEHETSIINERGRRVTVTRHQADDGPTDLFLTIRDLEGPADQEHGSARLTGAEAEHIAHALLSVDDHHDTEPYTAFRAPERARRLGSYHYSVGRDGSVTENDPNGYTGWLAEPHDAALDKARQAEKDRADAAGLGVHLPADPGSAHTRILEQADEIKALKADRDYWAESYRNLFARFVALEAERRAAVARAMEEE